MMLTDGLAAVAGVERAFIYGSWALSEQSNLGLGRGRRGR